ncbi:hypothetical protein ETB97_002036 [Aspergillus alliaceus]|uniref:Nudix hydrolase domain-containing protein n=1 Tax=Petromyces alliaceus TaxID=209559 RepID=A0A8H6A555_PETAA|nr:hypothetical protein ETB97_002036 [Aspergillus burnettii]
MTPPIPSERPTHGYHSSPSLKPYQTPVNTYISQRPSDQLVGILCASIIIHRSRVLLIQRVPDDDYPNLWEAPGGVADDGETIVDCAVRELREETGLRASAVTGLVGELEWDDSLPGPIVHSKRGLWKVFIFRVVVEGEGREELEVTIDPKEHQGYLWVTEEEARRDMCGDMKLAWVSLDLKKIVLEALECCRDDA